MPEHAYINIESRIRGLGLVRLLGYPLTRLPIPGFVQVPMLRFLLSLVRPQYRIGSGQWLELGRIDLRVSDDGAELEFTQV